MRHFHRLLEKQKQENKSLSHITYNYFFINMLGFPLILGDSFRSPKNEGMCKYVQNLFFYVRINLKEK